MSELTTIVYLICVQQDIYKGVHQGIFAFHYTILHFRPPPPPVLLKLDVLHCCLVSRPKLRNDTGSLNRLPIEGQSLTFRRSNR